MKFHTILFTTTLTLIILFGASIGTSVSYAQTGPLIDIYDKLKPVEQLFNQDGLLTQKNAQAVLIARVARIVNIVLSLLGIIMVVLIIYAGYHYMLARGNQEIVEKAQETIRNAATGLVIIIISYALTAYLLTRLLEVSRG